MQAVPGPPATVTLDVWLLPPRDAARAALATVHHARRSRRHGARFAKLLGTGDQRFTAAGAQWRRFAAVTAWSDPRDVTPVRPVWARRAQGWWHADLAPLRSRGRWSGRTPFVVPPVPPPPSGSTPRAGGPSALGASGTAARWTGPVLSLTRARLRPTTAGSFWRAVPAVADRFRAADGLRVAFGIGEAPVGVQGTVSMWRDGDAALAFARHDPAHRNVVVRTAPARWYAEELFARFAVVGTAGGADAVGIGVGDAA